MSNQNREKAPTRQFGPGPGRGHGGPGGPMRMSGEKPKDFKSAASQFLREISRYKVRLLGVIIFAISSCLFSVAAPRIMGNAINIVADGVLSAASGSVGIDFTALVSTLLLMLFVYTISSLCSYAQSFIVSGVSASISYDFRRRISEKINKLPLKYFDKISHGDVLSRITNDVDTISNALNQSLSQIVTSVTSVVGVFIMMLIISPVMTLIAVVVLPVTPLLVSFVVKRSQKFFKRQQEYLGKVNGQVEEAFSGHLIIKAFGAEKDIINEYNEFNDELYKSAWKSQFFSSLMQPIMGFIGNLSYVAVCLVGSFMALKGSIQIGSISAFIQYMRNFTQPITQIAQISSVLQSSAAAAERVFDFLNEPEEADESHKGTLPSDIKGEVVFQNVSFGYSEESKVINNFSSKIEPSKTIAIVGPTGAGKTTLVKLLMHYYEINDGAIYIDGVDISTVSRESLRSVFGMVLQDAWLFSGTIKDNIRLGMADASDEDVYDACKAANVHRYIKTLPGGYDYVIDEESSNISQGQKQLLTIARAFLAKPKILILDEATSSVDTRTELLIQKAMARLMEGKTSFVIAHRLSTIKDADMIIVINNGDIVECGNHNELLSKGGFYHELYYSQFEGGKAPETKEILATS